MGWRAGFWRCIRAFWGYVCSSPILFFPFASLFFISLPTPPSRASNLHGSAHENQTNSTHPVDLRRSPRIRRRVQGRHQEPQEPLLPRGALRLRAETRDRRGRAREKQAARRAVVVVGGGATKPRGGKSRRYAELRRAFCLFVCLFCSGCAGV